MEVEERPVNAYIIIIILFMQHVCANSIIGRGCGCVADTTPSVDEGWNLLMVPVMTPVLFLKDTVGSSMSTNSCRQMGFPI